MRPRGASLRIVAGRVKRRNRFAVISTTALDLRNAASSPDLVEIRRARVARDQRVQIASMRRQRSLSGDIHQRMPPTPRSDEVDELTSAGVP
jgi:hypothetical protein